MLEKLKNSLFKLNNNVLFEVLLEGKSNVSL